MKTIKEIIAAIEEMDIPEGNISKPNTKEWAKLKLSIAKDLENEFEYGEMEEDEKNEYKEVLKDWNEFYDEFGPKKIEVSNESETKEEDVVELNVEQFNKNIAKSKEDNSSTNFVKCDSNEIIPDSYSYDFGFSKVDGLKLKVQFMLSLDFMGVEKRVPHLSLFDEEEPYCTLTVHFGEFIGQMCTTYIDTNNNSNVEEFMLNNHIGFKTSFTKRSGWCEYPLYVINPKLLAQTEDWEKYRKDFDFYDDGDVLTLEELTKMFYEELNKRL